MKWWLALAYPTAVLALLASFSGIFTSSTYAQETRNWAGQAIGQDIANVVAYVALVPLTEFARRGSLRALLCWIGVIAYGIYAYAIYAFSVHFGGFFLVYVAVLGLSVFALIGSLGSIAPERVRLASAGHAPRRSTAVVLVTIGVLFALLWLSEIVPAIAAGKTPESLRTAGLVSNPVYVLDLALLLPATIIGGTLLVRDRAWGFVLAPMLLTVLALLSLGIVAGFVTLARWGEEVPVAVGVVIAAIALGQLATLIRFLSAIDTTAASRATRVDDGREAG